MTEENDKLVTQTYRDGEQERAPEHLNRAILKSAADSARPRYSRLTTWTRPMAWAATVMLSVALVLEVTKVPSQVPASFDDVAKKLESAASDLDQPVAVPASEVAAEEIEEELMPATAAPGRASNVAVTTPQSEPEKASNMEAAPEPALEKRQRDEVRRNDAAKQGLATQALISDEFELKDTQMLQRAEDMARLQNGNQQEFDRAAPAATALAVSIKIDTEANCPEALTATAESWLECIANLEGAGLDTEAEEQRELLRAAFPDVDIP